VFSAAATPPPAATTPAATSKDESVKATGAPVLQYERVPGQDYKFVTMRNDKGFLEVRVRRSIPLALLPPHL